MGKKYGFFTCLGDNPIGFASYDIRNKPDYLTVGHNCVIPKYQNKGYGTYQLKHCLDILKKLDCKKIKTSTGDHDFFIPARKMYRKCGFSETGEITTNRIPYFKIIHYILEK